MRRASRDSAPRRLLLALLLPVAAGAASACREAPEPNLHPPDPILQDSLGLTSDDRVFRITLGTRDGSEIVDPPEVVVRPGDYVEFLTTDRRVRTVSFFVDSLGHEQAEFMRAGGQDRSPPLVELESRFVVSFADAPPGRYPFVVDGNQLSIAGSVTVEGPPPE